MSTGARDPESFEQIISGYSDEIRSMAGAVRNLIFEILPGATEVVWQRQKIAGYGTGPKKMSEHYHWIQPAKKHVVLGFNYGAEIPDPEGLLEGTGKMFRHVKVKDVSQLEDAALHRMMRFATTHRVPPISSDS